MLLGTLYRLTLCVMLGVAAAIYAVALTQTDPRTAAIGWVALAGAAGLLCLGSARRIALALLIILATTLPIFIGKFFFVHLRAPDQYVSHLANVGVQFSIPVAAAIAFLAVQFLTPVNERPIRGFRIEPVTASGAAFVIASGILTLINAADARLVWFETLRFALLFLLTFVVAILDRRAMRLFLLALAAAVLLQGLLALGQYASGGSLGLTILGELPTRAERIDFVDIVRPSGTFGNANALGGFFALTLPLLLGLLLVSDRRCDRIVYGAAFALGLGGLIATLSRGAWLSLPLTLMIVTVVVLGRRLFTLKAGVAMAALGLTAVAAAIVIGPLIITRLTGDDAGSALSRLPMISATMSVIEQFPIFGAGLNNFADALVRHDRTGFVQVALAGRDNSLFVHNLYLLVWAETGVVGLLAFLWYVVSAFVVAYLVIRRSRASFDRAVACGAALGLFAQMVQGAFDIGFRVPFGSLGSLVACQIGLIAAVKLWQDEGRNFTRAAEPASMSASSGGLSQR